MDYKQDWHFNKFSKLLLLDNQKERLYNLYKHLTNSSKKRLFLYLNYTPSNIIIKELLDMEGILTLDGITTYLSKDKQIFQNDMAFRCKNITCTHNKEYLKSKSRIIKLCPKCEDEMILVNKESIINTFFALYINYFNFFLLNDVDKTLYVIRNKYNGKIYFKGSDESLTNWLHIKLLENNCNVERYLFINSNGKSKKGIKIQLLDFLKNSGCMTTIDNINFKPVKDIVYKENQKKYLNMYRGNEFLNSNFERVDDEDYLLNCVNIKELLFNLTGKDEKGVDYLLDVLAMIIQEPYIKTQQLIIFYGEEAAGKGTFYELILKPLFSGFITKILGKKIKSTFNSFMSQKLVLVLEEVKADKEEEDTLKELVTEETIMINPKNLPEREENNYLTTFGFSNEQNPISAGKRRGVYFRSRTLGGSINKAPSFRKKYEENIPLEFEYLIKELKTRKYDRTEVLRGYYTEAKKQVHEQNMSVIERFYNELIDYENLSKYIDAQITTGLLDINNNLLNNLYTYNEIKYIKAQFLLDLYNSYLRQNKYKSITLNKFSEFWQLMKIDRDNKEHFNRFKGTGHKVTYVNLNIINDEIKKRYLEDE